MPSVSSSTGLRDCVFCRARAAEFGPFGLDLPVFTERDIVGGGRRDGAQCPGCGSFDRERLVYLYLLHRTDVLSAPRRVLHIAPEARVGPRLAEAQGVAGGEYVAGDLNPTGSLVRVDVTALEFADATFDAIICNHVLEHVTDDAKAMRELRRVLKPGGWAMLQVPLAMALDQTHEDWTITDPAARERAFGQNDHVRLYGRDYPERLRRAGFDVELFDWTAAGEDFGAPENRFGLIERERLHIARAVATPGAKPVCETAVGVGDDAVVFEGNVLPAPHLRFCTTDFRDDAFFVASARREADRLIERCGLKPWSSLLDIGCGQGRLAIGVIDRFREQGGIKRFEGVDVSAPSIDWCSRNLARGKPWMHFRHTHVRNERYNPDGTAASGVAGTGGRVLPFDDEVFDVINLFSVFTHMTAQDVGLYLKEVARLLAPRGRAFCTAYVEPNVEDYTENPRGYRGDHAGRLHRVRFSNQAFDRLVIQAGLKVDRFDHAAEFDGQTGVYLSRWLTKPPLPEGRRLEIGPGAERMEGFETLNIAPGPNVDHVADAAGRLPFDDATFSLIYASHILEHVPWYLTEQTLREWVRVLAPGGLLEVWVPDALKIARAFVDAEDAQAGRAGEDRTINDGWYRFNPERDPCVWAAGRTFTYGDGPTPAGGVNYASPNWHRALFSPRRLEQCLRAAGLVDVQRLDRSQVRGDDHGWINLGFRGVKPDVGKAVGGVGEGMAAERAR